MLKKILFICAISLTIGGCASHSHQIAQGSSSLKGEFSHIQPTKLVLETAGQRYVAEGFEVQRHTNKNELNERYRISNPKHWWRISAGLDKDHETYSAEAKAISQDGEELICSLAWQSRNAPKGMCRDKNDKVIEVVFD